MCENEHERSTDFCKYYGFSEEIACKSLAIALLEEFEERFFFTYGDVDPEAYVAAYPGHDRENFAKMLSVSHLLLTEGLERCRQGKLTKDPKGTEAKTTQHGRR